ncbi:MAG: 3-hydroxyacyl-CoA dehydrogenase family protein [Firmicutes bacterium]|nr:3-hydroxyacyl-CoA dehydrogenase family protein [Alicyclobacillaceae bacterium]MCL6497549.1 3-hydroxyacyl-CoA dehydrogenase family protein [Bacillota bacterium]
MTSEAIRQLAVIGAGAMGSGIAHLAAQSGLTVVLYDRERAALEAAQRRIRGLIDRAVEKGRVTAEEAERQWERLRFSEAMDPVAEADFCVEAVFESYAVKEAVFRTLDGMCRPEVILATNTSSIPITSIAAATARRDKVVGMHFFNPPQVMRLVEVVRGLDTSDETVAVTRGLAERMGKTTVEVKRDTPGFIVNRIMVPQFIEAIRLVEEGVASIEDVDTAVKLGLNYPMGPFELQDFGGLEIALHVMDVFYEETKDDRYAAPQSLRTLVRAGRLGRKTGRGWYDYEGGEKR